MVPLCSVRSKEGWWGQHFEKVTWFISTGSPFHNALENTQATFLNSPTQAHAALKLQFKRWLWNFTGQKPYTSSQSISPTPEPSDKNALSSVPLGLNGGFLAGNLLTSNNDLECLSFSAVPIFIHSIWGTRGCLKSLAHARAGPGFVLPCLRVQDSRRLYIT